MGERNMESVIPTERIQRRIYLLRGEKVLLSHDLAELYGVETRRLNEQVQRNHERFPVDFMFQLADEETEFLKSQIATSNRTRGGRRYRPYAFTEQGVAMLSSVLRSKRAVEVNIAIMRTFVQLTWTLGVPCWILDIQLSSGAYKQVLVVCNVYQDIGFGHRLGSCAPCPGQSHDLRSGNWA